MTFRNVFALATIGSLGALACSGMDEGATVKVEGPQQGHDWVAQRHGVLDESHPFSETVVHVQADGSQKVDIYYRSAEEARADKEAIERTRIEGSSGPAIEGRTLSYCFGADFFAWDQTGGVGHSLCFFYRKNLEVDVDLSLYSRGALTWLGGVWSYQGGQRPFQFASLDSVNADPADGGSHCATQLTYRTAVQNVPNDGCSIKSAFLRLVP